MGVFDYHKIMSEHDKDLKVGDIVTAYNAGYHRVTRIERRFTGELQGRFGTYYTCPPNGKEMSSLIHYECVARENGEKPKRLRSSFCDAQYCELASQTIKKQIQLLNQLVVDLKL